MLISILTGIAAGALHVVGGVDHLVAMAPSGVRQPKQALRNGLAWGLGHSMGVLILSSIAILVKDFANIERISSFAEICVGVSLLVVGGFAINSAFGLNIHSHRHNHRQGMIHDHIHIHFRGRKKHLVHHHASTSLGFLHGLAGASHFLAVIPALALPPLGAIAYMFSYFLGSFLSMGLFLFALSLACFKIGSRALPSLIGMTGVLSISTGVFWLQRIFA